jgi:hypothetical protein
MVSVTAGNYGRSQRCKYPSFAKNLSSFSFQHGAPYMIARLWLQAVGLNGDQRHKTKMPGRRIAVNLVGRPWQVTFDM